MQLNKKEKVVCIAHYFSGIVDYLKIRYIKQSIIPEADNTI